MSDTKQLAFEIFKGACVAALVKAGKSPIECLHDSIEMAEIFEAEWKSRFGGPSVRPVSVPTNHLMQKFV